MPGWKRSLPLSSRHRRPLRRPSVRPGLKALEDREMLDAAPLVPGPLAGSESGNVSRLYELARPVLLTLANNPVVQQAENPFLQLLASAENAFNTLRTDAANGLSLLDQQLRRTWAAFTSLSEHCRNDTSKPSNAGTSPFPPVNGSAMQGGMRPLDSSGPAVSLYLGSNSMVQEGSTSALVVGQLSAASSQTVTVQFATSNGTASAGKDYTATNGTLTFNPGATQATANVPLLDDGAVNEPDSETFNVTLSNPSNATLGSPSTGVYQILEDSDGGLHPPPPSLASNLCNCGCLNEPGSLAQGAVQQVGQIVSNALPFPVRYADGVATIAETDLHSDGFGFPWGQTRIWSNGQGYAQGSDNGNGWVDTYTPHLIQADGSTDATLIVIANGSTAYYYDQVNGGFQSRYNDGSQLTYNSSTDTFTLIDTSGDTIVFNGFGSTRPAAQQGEFASFTNPGGQTMAVTSYTSDGHIAEMQRSETTGGNTTIESWLYSYLPSGNANAGQLSNVTLRTQTNGGAWNVVQQVQYTYYDGTQQYGGNPGDLMTASVEDGSGNVLNTSYYRYYTFADIQNGQSGYVDGLKYVFNPASYTRLTAALGTNVSSLTDAQVAAYADNYFQYDYQQRVTLETVQGAGDSQTSGGLGTYTLSYSASNNVPDFNNWATQTVVGNPDGSSDTVFTNFVGQTLLDDHFDPSNGQDTVQAWRYNESGQLILAAAPSAVNGYNVGDADLLNNQDGSYQYLNNNSGLITQYQYYSTTTAGETMAGGVANYLEEEQIQQGQQGTLIPQETWQYYAHAYNGQTIAPTAPSRQPPAIPFTATATAPEPRRPATPTPGSPTRRKSSRRRTRLRSSRRRRTVPVRPT